MSHGVCKQHVVYSVVCSYSAVEQYNGLSKQSLESENIHNAALSGPRLLHYSYYIIFV